MLEQFKATMKLFGYTQFTVCHAMGGLDVTVHELIYDAAGWPALWAVCDKLGVGRGCGQRYYHQIKDGTLPIGVYEL
jgi:hypothetical protein